MCYGIGFVLVYSIKIDIFANPDKLFPKTGCF